MAMHLANQLDTVEEGYVSHGAFRPFAFSKSITETTTYEYDPELETRVVSRMANSYRYRLLPGRER